MYDLHGNVTGYLDASGSVAARYEYNATGQVIASSGNASSFAFGHSTQFTDPETGWVYFGLRFYNPKHGRFINRDPIHEQGGLNLYGYVQNSPTNGWDYLGLDPWMECFIFEKFNPGTNGWEETGRKCFLRFSSLPDSNNGEVVGPGNAAAQTGQSARSGGANKATNKTPAKTRCDELKKKYGDALSAQEGGLFDNINDARTAAYVNSFLGGRDLWEYGSLVVDNQKMAGMQDVPKYYVSPSFSNWMVGLPITTHGGALATTEFPSDPAFKKAIGPSKRIERPDGLGPTIGYPDNAIIEAVHRHPTVAGLNGSDRNFAREWNIGISAVAADGEITYFKPGSGKRTTSDNSLISQQDLLDLKSCFGEGRK